MRSPAYDRSGTAVWDVVRPARPSKVAGVSMAGFRDCGVHPVNHRAIPHPAVTLLLSFGAGSPTVTDANGRAPGSLVAGPGFGLGSGAVWVRGESIECVQVRLSPVVAPAVLGVSPADVEGAVAPLDDLWGREASRICEELAEASSWDERFALIDALLGRRGETGRLSVDPEVAWAWDRIVGSRGRIRVERLAEEIGWSRQRLWSRFQSQLGLPPKSAAKLARFDHAAHRLGAGDGPARVAAEGGYTDQSHLHRDVVALTGVGPATMVSEPWLAVDDIAWPSHGSAHTHPRSASRYRGRS